MSAASHRSLARLPLCVFENLLIDAAIEEEQEQDERTEKDEEMVVLVNNPTLLRSTICEKLLSVKTEEGGSNKTTKVKTVWEFLLLPTYTVMQALDPLLTYDECCELERRIAKQCAGTSTNALGLLQKQCCTPDATSTALYPGISTALPALDQQLRPFGGLAMGSITEIVGPAGVGKSQFAYQLCLEAVWSGGRAIYLDTEGKASWERLQEMVANRASLEQVQHKQQQSSQTQSQINHGTRPIMSATQALEYIDFCSCSSVQDLLDNTLAQVEDDIYRRNEYGQDHENPADYNLGEQNGRPVRLVVLDSIASPFRRNHLNMHERSTALLQIAQVLKRLAYELNLCVVVTNQVGTTFSSETTDIVAENGPDEDLSVRAALGTAWYHSVSTRIQLEPQSSWVEAPNSLKLPRNMEQAPRAATIVKSNLVRATGNQVCFTIRSQGIVPTTTKTV